MNLRRIISLACLITTINMVVVVSNAQEIKVLSYNIYHGERFYENGKSNLSEIADLIKIYKPDFVAMQEVDSMTNRTKAFNDGRAINIMEELAKLTGMYGYFGKGINYDGGGYGEGLLSKYQMMPIVDSLPIPAGGEGRALISFKYKLPNGQEILFAGTHLCHNYEENRIAQVEAVSRLLLRQKLPVIVAGDFNLTPESKPYQIMRDKWNDAAEIKGNPVKTYPFTDPDMRIDYVFFDKTSKWVVKDVVTLKIDASDHLPLMVTLELRKN